MPHIVYLMSDTGGGHRAACRAIETALNTRYPAAFTAQLVDMWRDYTPFPFSTLPDTYVKWVNWSPGTYAAQYWMNDRIWRSPALSNALCRQMFPRMKLFFERYPADLYLCAHSVFVRPAIHALRKLGIQKPFMTVITDYALPNIMWYDPRVDLTTIPTEAAYQRGVRLGLPPEKMVMTGAPVHPKYTDLKLSKAEARDALGWSPTARIVLMVGGGDGMGTLQKTARAIDRLALDAELVIIAGRNTALKKSLEACQWQRPTHIYGFVNNLEVMMRAADLLITKAGPATLTEAATIGLPMVISGAIRFQESPNVKYVVSRNAGVFAPGARKVAAAVAELLADDGAHLKVLSEGVKTIAEPHAVWRIAELVHTYATGNTIAAQANP
ncbi:MAG: glycosyltransferase [Chloroflexi bacterium CFX4]|nr:glycosyltransferase [Chloroflexi bacterium CFX4]MDL1923661.1 glycosyltransferase [Chloroflexi bacterium CFX3]